MRITLGSVRVGEMCSSTFVREARGVQLGVEDVVIVGYTEPLGVPAHRSHWVSFQAVLAGIGGAW